MSSQRIAAKSLPRLTAKQRDVLALVADNRTSKEIAGLLGISESAVNQRIEIVRAQLGGLPRGELARLFRQEFSTGEAEDGPTWQKIHLSDEPPLANGDDAEGISGVAPAGTAHRDGSQLSAFIFKTPANWLNSDARAMMVARASAVLGIFALALMIAAILTVYLAPDVVGG